MRRFYISKLVAYNAPRSWQMSDEKMCSHCGENPAVTLKITKQDPDLDGLGVGCYETLEVLQDNDISDDDSDFYLVTGYCSETCIHLAGEYAHAMVRDD